MTKQVFELISDATVLSDIHSLGAVIIRVKSNSLSEGTENSSHATYLTICKSLFIYKMGDSSQAELLAGLYGINWLLTKINTDSLNFSHSRWIMDIPHIETIMLKFKQENIENVASLPSKVLDIIKENGLQIRLPRGSKETAKHHLCHRICTQGRIFYEENNILQFRHNFSSYLTKIGSGWKIHDENLQDI